MAEKADIASEIRDGLIARLGSAWENRLTPDERALVTACTEDAAILSVNAMATPVTREGQEQLIAERRQIDAQLANITAAAEVQLVKHFWEAVQFVVSRALGLIVAVI